MLYRPVRERTPEHLKDMIIHQLKNTGYDELSLLSLSTSDYSKFEPFTMELMDICRKQDVALSLPSLSRIRFHSKCCRKYKDTENRDLPLLRRQVRRG